MLDCLQMESAFSETQCAAELLQQFGGFIFSFITPFGYISAIPSKKNQDTDRQQLVSWLFIEYSVAEFERRSNVFQI